MKVLRTKNPKTDPDTNICAHLGFSVSICSGHPIDIKMHSHESLGQHDHEDTTCTQFGLRTFRHGNLCTFRVFGPNLFRAFDWHKNAFTRVLRSTRSQRHYLHSIWTLSVYRVSARFFSGRLIDTKIILNELLGQHDQNDASCTQIEPQMRKLSLIKVLTLWVRVSLNGHAYIGLYLTHACQKHFWKAEKLIFLPMHISQCMAKRSKLKVTQKRCFKWPKTKCRTTL